MPQKQLDILAVLNGRIDNSFTNMGTAITSLGSMVNQISQPLINMGKEGLEIYGNYEQNMRDAEGALSTSYDSTYELNGVMDGLNEAAQQWAASTKFTTEDVSLAISEAAHAGYDYEQILQAMPQTMLLAQAGNLDLSTSLDYVIKSTNALGMDLDDLGTFIDQWAMGANSSATTIDEFGEAMLRMGSTMQFADSTAELFTMLGVLANTGTTGSDAGTLLRNSMLRLVAPTKKAQEAMASLGDVTDEEMAELQTDSAALSQANEALEAVGFSAYDSSGQLKPMLQIFHDLYDATGQMSEADQYSVLSAMFPTRTITGAMNLLKAAAEDYDGLYEKISDSGGYAEEVSEIQMDSLTGKTAIFESKLEELKRSIGEVLAPQVEAGESFIGGFIDKLNELPEDKLSMLVTGLEGIAVAGPAMMTLGMFVRLLGMIPSPIAIVTAGVLGLATALGAVSAYNDMTITENFGTVSLDIDTLKKSLDSLDATDEETKFAGLDAYISELQGYADEYQTAAGTFSQQITIAGITNTALDTTQQNQLKQLGMSMIASVQSGINTGRNYYLTALNSAFADDTDALSGETTVPDSDYEVYSQIYDDINEQFGTLESEAATLQSRFSACLAQIFNDDGTINQAAAAEAEQIIQEMNEVEAQIMAFDTEKRNAAMLRKSQTVSLESWEEYMDTIEEYQQADIDAINEHYDNLEAAERIAMDARLKREGKAPMTDEDWLGSDEYRALESERQESLQPTYDKYGQYAAEGFNTAMEQSDFADTWSKIQEIQAGARDENGNFDFSKVNMADYFSSAQEVRDFQKSLQEMTTGDGLKGIFSGDPRLAEMVEDFRYSDAVAPLFEAIDTIAPGMMSLVGEFMSGYDDMDSYFRMVNESRAKQQQEPAEPAPTEVYGPPRPTDEQVAAGWRQVQALKQAPEAGAVTSAEGEGMTATVTKAEAAEGLTLEGVTASVSSVEFAAAEAPPVDVTANSTIDAQPSVTGTAEAASQAHSELQSGMDAAGDVTATSTISNAAEAGAQGWNDIQLVIDAMGKVHVNGVVYNASELPAEIRSAILAGSPYTFTAKANVIGMPSGGKAGGFASGGRADSPSMFGEAGPEWAIPERHTAATASLINQTIRASGFDWDELYSMFAGDSVPDASEAPQPMSPETISAVTGLEGLVSLIDSLLPLAGYGAQTGEDAEPLQLPALPAFAEGGRTSEPSLFGEGGPEWAIPERHSSATAMLIDQARSASGFSWDELQSVSGDTSNTSTASTTLVYSPTIVASDATDVESKLREDKARLQEQMERWWRDRETREQLEVYAT